MSGKKNKKPKESKYVNLGMEIPRRNTPTSEKQNTDKKNTEEKSSDSND